MARDQIQTEYFLIVMRKEDSLKNVESTQSNFDISRGSYFESTTTE